MDKTILITGGGRGIGAATALLAAEKGYAVGVNYRDQQAAAEQIVETIHQRGGRAIAIQADVSNEQEVKAMFQTFDRAFGTLTALVNNAGILGDLSPFIDISAERIQHTFQVNVLGVCCARRKPCGACRPGMAARVALL